MTAQTRMGLEIVAAGAAGGILGDALLRAMPWGLNVTICTAALVAAGVWLVRRHDIKPGPDAPWLAITALLLGAAFVRRDTAALAQFDVLALIVSLAFAAASLQGERIKDWRLIDYVRSGASATLGSIVGSLFLVGHDVKWQELPRDERLRRVRAVTLGILIAAPLLVIFAALFASADQVFSNVLTNVFSFDARKVVQHTFFICFWAALAAGYLRWSFFGRPVVLPVTAGINLGITPLATVLALLNGLFLLFVVVQLRYFFGGTALVESTSGLTYAEYARRGFFELVTASALVLPILLGADYLIREGTPGQIKLTRQLSGLLLLLLVVIMASALGRMRLYVSAYGLSAPRLYATAFMIFLVGVFAWFAWTVLRGNRRRFAFGALMQGLAVLAGLHVLNPDALIARTNLNRPTVEQQYDAKYATTLGADAVPVLIAGLPKLSPQDRCLTITALLRRWNKDGDSDWRSWNWSRSRARRLVRSQAADLRASCTTAPREAP